MERKKVVPAWIGILGLVLTIVCLISIFSSIGRIVSGGIGNSILNVASCITKIIALIAALFYFLFGYKKKAAVFYKAFVHSFALSCFIATLVSNNIGIFYAAVAVANFGVICLLAFGKDLGRKQSFILAGIKLALDLLNTIVYAISSHLSVMMCGTVLLSVLLGITVYAKYTDKAARGTN